MEHEILWEPRPIPPDGLNQDFGVHSIQLSQIKAQQYALPADREDAVCQAQPGGESTGHAPISRGWLPDRYHFAAPNSADTPGLHREEGNDRQAQGCLGERVGAAVRPQHDHGEVRLKCEAEGRTS